VVRCGDRELDPIQQGEQGADRPGIPGEVPLVRRPEGDALLSTTAQRPGRLFHAGAFIARDQGRAADCRRRGARFR
jgi:hypothetical protein